MLPNTLPYTMKRGRNGVFRRGRDFRKLFDPSITPGTTNKYTITSFAIVIEEQDPADDSDDDSAGDFCRH